MPAHFGLDIGSSSIKVARLDGEKAILGLAVNPTGKVGVDLTAAEKDSLALTIKKLIAKSKLGTRKVVISIPESLIFSKVMEFPVVSNAELAHAIKWQADQSIPLSPEEIDLSWVVIKKPKRRAGVERMQVLVIAVPKKVSADYVDFLGLLGLEPVRAENETLALGRLLVLNRQIKDPVLIVDIGASATKMILFNGGLVRLTHSVNTGGLALTRILATTFKLMPRQAEQYKRVYGADQNQLEGRLYRGMEVVLNSLLTELGKVIRLGMVAGQPVRVLLVGGGSYLKGLVGLLSKKLGTEVVIGDVFGSLRVDQSQKQLGVVYGVALGLAAEEKE